MRWAPKDHERKWDNGQDGQLGFGKVIGADPSALPSRKVHEKYITIKSLIVQKSPGQRRGETH